MSCLGINFDPRYSHFDCGARRNAPRASAARPENPLGNPSRQFVLGAKSASRSDRTRERISRRGGRLLSIRRRGNLVFSRRMSESTTPIKVASSRRRLGLNLHSHKRGASSGRSAAPMNAMTDSPIKPARRFSPQRPSSVRNKPGFAKAGAASKVRKTAGLDSAASRNRGAPAFSFSARRTQK